jgi:PleD family two-component response regulator
VTLPVTDEHPAGEAEAVAIVARALASSRLPSLNNLRVLVVDDEPDARELVRAILAQCGAEVTVAATARVALEAGSCPPTNRVACSAALPEAVIPVRSAVSP